MSPTWHPVRLYTVQIAIERESHFRMDARLRGHRLSLPDAAHPDRSRTVTDTELPDTLAEMCARAMRYGQYRAHVVTVIKHGSVTRPRIDEIREEVALEHAEGAR